jgi:lysophospholipase L1-like esterase
MKTRIIITLIIITFIIVLFSISHTQSANKEKIWDYVILGSSIGTRGWPKYYGDYIENDLGVTVVSHNYSTNYQGPSELLETLRNKEELIEDVRNAEVITIGVGFNDMYNAVRFHGAGGSNQPQKIAEKLKSFREDYNAALNEIISLSSENTLIRVMDYYCPYAQSHKDSGIYEDTKHHWMEFNKVISEVAEKHDVPIAQVFQAMNGEDGNADPNVQGYLSSDGKHLSDKGYQVVAKLFRELGYD